MSQCPQETLHYQIEKKVTRHHYRVESHLLNQTSPASNLHSSHLIGCLVVTSDLAFSKINFCLTYHLNLILS
jgi:hypothetical protein